MKDTTIEFVGNFSEIFGSNIQLNQKYTWGELVDRVEYSVAFQWEKALQSAMSRETNSVYLNDSVIMSFDSQRLYRIFASQITQYYDDTMEYQVYAIRILREKDSGDQTTTLLLHAVESSLSYRFLFLEGSLSDFSPETFQATPISALLDRTSSMIDTLTMLLVRAQQYELGDPKNILLILGSDNLNQIATYFATWDEAKKSLYEQAKNILAKGGGIQVVDQKELVKSVQSFCDKTRDMNRSYTTAVLGKLQTILFEAAKEYMPV